MIRIAFVDFWDDFNSQSNFISDSFSRITEVEIVRPSEKPDILVYSIFGYENLFYHDCIRLYYTGENDVPDFNLCDYAISFQHLIFGKRHLRLPIYARWKSFELLRSGQRMKEPGDARGFCSFVVSNNFCASPMRTEIFDRLSDYKFVASGGRYANNIGGPVDDKLKFLNKYKFNIAFENSAVDGYTTEKIFDALAASTVPIYWGNPRVTLDVNPESYINISDFSSLDDAVKYIEMVDKDDSLYQKYLYADPLKGNVFMEWEQKLDDFIRNIVENPIKYVPDYGLSAQIHQNALEKEELFHSSALRRFLKYYKKLKNKNKKNES